MEPGERVLSILDSRPSARGPDASATTVGTLGGVSCGGAFWAFMATERDFEHAGGRCRVRRAPEVPEIGA